MRRSEATMLRARARLLRRTSRMLRYVELPPSLRWLPWQLIEAAAKLEQAANVVDGRGVPVEDHAAGAWRYAWDFFVGGAA